MIRRARWVLLCLAATSLARGQAGAPPGTYTVTRIADYAYVNGINNFGQVVGSGAQSAAQQSADLLQAFLWTPTVANGTAGSLMDLNGSFTAPPSSFGLGINDRGQVVGQGNVHGEDGFLWSPDTSNGTSGTMVAFAGNAEGVAINSYGQIEAWVPMAGPSGTTTGVYQLWTPSVPNGTTGTFNPDPGLQNLGAINDFGQMAINNPDHLSDDWILFTPSTPNGATGTFTNVALPTGATGPYVVAINTGGAVLGSSYDPGVAGFLWTPSSPNGTVGTTIALTPPSGIAGFVPTALNAAGQVVGYLQRADYTVIAPFLYINGVVYDLSALDSRLAGGGAFGINDHGQIAVQVLPGTVYLVTPSVSSPPRPGEIPVTIASNPPGQTFSVAGNGCRPGGYTTPQTLGWIPGSACTVTFLSPQASAIGARYFFSGWQDGGITSNPRTITAAAQATTFTANFAAQYYVNAYPDSPGGTVSGSGWYNAGANAAITATPASGYRLVVWNGAPGPSDVATTITLNMTAPYTVSAHFAPSLPGPPGSYVVTQVATSDSASPSQPINNFGQVVGPAVGYYSVVNPLGEGFLWTPTSGNGTSGHSIDLGAQQAAGINDRGQVVGTGANGPFLWSPDAPNGTTGTMAAFLGSPGSTSSTAIAINSFGQILGTQGNGYYLWTPATANGIWGTSTFLPYGTWASGTAGINDFGQVVVQSTLFTPFAANGTAGTFTQVSGLGEAIAINDGGTILSATCASYGFCTSAIGYLWTPSTPNGSVGTLREIPLPAGFLLMQPTAMNAKGDVVGLLSLADGTVTPFLYSGGTVYDLSTVSPQLVGGIAAGINDRGQIVISTGGLPFNANSAVYLLTPTAIQPPAPGGVSPASGSGFSQTMSFTFSDPNGWQDLDVVNILINGSLDGRNACYLAYSRPQNMLYLVNDAGGGLSPGLTLNGNGVVSNSQCIVMGAGSAVSGSGNTLTVTLNLSFTAGFAGNQIVYMAAGNVAGSNSGWQPLGTWDIPAPPANGPAVGGMSPARSNALTQTYTFTFTDPNGWQDLAVTDILINGSLDGRHACYLAFAPSGATSGSVFLVDDAGDAGGPFSGMALPGSGLAQNSQCSVNATGSSVAASGNTLTLTLAITFSQSFAGNRVFYLAARSNGLNSNWQAAGSVTVP